MKDIRKVKLEGLRFGRLLVLEYLHGKSKYRCKCDCGAVKDIWTGDFKSGKTKSCGCLNKEHELDLVGKKFNMLTVVERVGKTPEHRYLFRCICDCGEEKVAEGREIKRGKIMSCGRHNAEKVSEANTTHGMTGERIYNIYLNMKGRCSNSNNQAYVRYGGRGISVCDEWTDKENGFTNFLTWSLSNGYKEDLSIDRIDNNGNYEPANCRWTTNKVQQNNRGCSLLFTYNDETKPLTVWCEELNLKYDSVWKRINKYNYDFEKAITYKTERVKLN